MSGQSTLEYLLVLSAFAAMVGVLGLLWHAASDGALVGLAAASASHGSGQGAIGQLKDVAVF